MQTDAWDSCSESALSTGTLRAACKHHPKGAPAAPGTPQALQLSGSKGTADLQVHLPCSHLTWTHQSWCTHCNQNHAKRNSKFKCGHYFIQEFYGPLWWNVLACNHFRKQWEPGEKVLNILWPTWEMAEAELFWNVSIPYWLPFLKLRL